MKKYDYSHLDEIKVRREDQQLYTLKKGDFLRLHLQDIEDMLLLLVQQKLTNLTIDERYDLKVALSLHDIASGIRIEDLPNKNCSRLNKRMDRVMIHNIDKLLFERRLIRNLEKFVGGREYENDLRLLERTI
nr:hypothetical protein [Tanacetum cinerariifolium]